MRKFIVSVAVATAALSAVPAAAQYQDRGHHQSRDYDRRVDQRALYQLHRELADVDQRIQQSLRRGAISQREATGLRRQANQLRQRLQRAPRNGFTGREYGQLRAQIAQLKQNVRQERRDRDRRRG